MPVKELAKGYEPRDVEAKWYSEWESKGYFHAEAKSDRSPYSIVIPPPNITGVLHMGHALNNTLQDILCRWKRMCGHNVLWMPGTDHAGIATQNVVERQLAAEKKDRFALGRDSFIQRVWQWKAESGGQIIGQLKRLGASCDWERERFTMDEGLSKAVRAVFVKLYEEGLIHRDNRLINWCPRCHTALSDIEVEHEEQKGHLWHLRYPVVGSDRHLVVATTRPETMLGDTAVAVNPADDRYSDLVGGHVMLPLVERKIPIIADDYVDMEFGTGVVKITPAHDFNDFEVGKRHNLERVNIFDQSGFINDQGKQYQGLDRFTARKRVLEDLEAQGLLEKIDDHALAVGGCYRCKTVVEPYLSLQWYVKVKSLAEPALDAVAGDNPRTRIYPDQWRRNYIDWMENIQDWCISRQIWWGHRIPAWYCDKCGEITVALNDPDSCKACGGAVTQDPDVLDTWFSSALWPFSTMGWPEKTDELATFYPTSCMVTGFDILFFWVARMMMMGIKFMGDVPFREVYIHALVRDAQGQKMSKSKGNVIDPLTVIDSYGTDAFRFTLAAFAAQGRDIKLAEERIAGYRNFANKIWNAARFTLMNLEGFDPDAIDFSHLPLSQGDRWILHRLNVTIAETARALEEYRYNEAAMGLYQFTWSEFCDWYVELSKRDLYGDDQERRETARYILWMVLESLLRLLHPFMPFITEEIWQNLPGRKEAPSIMLAPYPTPATHLEFPEAATEMERVMAVISAIRNIRGEMEVPPSKEIAVILSCGSDESLALMRHNEGAIMGLARVADLALGRDIEKPEDASIQVAGDVQIFVPLKGLVNVEEEEKRLAKEIAKIEKDIDFLGKKLENPSFVERAPADVVAKEKEKLAEFSAKRAILDESLEKIRRLS